MTVEQQQQALIARGTGLSHRELVNRLATDSDFKKDVVSLYLRVFKRTIGGCANSLADAYLELAAANPQTLMENAAVLYRLRAGALLQDVLNLDAAKMVSNKNITNELAEYHLATNPDCKARFSLLPPDWEARVQEYQNRHTELFGTSLQAAAIAEHTAEATTTTKTKSKRGKNANDV